MQEGERILSLRLSNRRGGNAPTVGEFLRNSRIVFRRNTATCVRLKPNLRFLAAEERHDGH